MTDPAVFRRRRRERPDEVSADLAAWFAGETSSTPWEALLPGDYELLPARWRAWSKTRPGARPPAGYAWIAAPADSPTH